MFRILAIVRIGFRRAFSIGMLAEFEMRLDAPFDLVRWKIDRRPRDAYHPERKSEKWGWDLNSLIGFCKRACGREWPKRSTFNESFEPTRTRLECVTTLCS